MFDTAQLVAEYNAAQRRLRRQKSANATEGPQKTVETIPASGGMNGRPAPQKRRGGAYKRFQGDSKPTRDLPPGLKWARDGKRVIAFYTPYDRATKESRQVHIGVFDTQDEGLAARAAVRADPEAIHRYKTYAYGPKSRSGVPGVIANGHGGWIAYLPEIGRKCTCGCHHKSVAAAVAAQEAKRRELESTNNG